MTATLRQAIADALVQLGIEGVNFSVEYPTDPTHGDYASNVAMVSAKAAGEVPRALAERLVEELAGKIEMVERVEVAGPGFLNFYLRRQYFADTVAGILQAGDGWGHNQSLAGEEVIIEYTSPNLFKPLHVGNLVGNIVGESIARLYEFAGATVRRINYPSDIGLSVAKAVWGLRESGGDATSINDLGAAYRRGNEAYESGYGKGAIEAVNRALYDDSDPALSELRRQGIATSKAHLDQLCAKLGTRFDAEIFESQAGSLGLSIVKENTGSVFTESDGAVVFVGEAAGLHTRVFINSQGLPTYEAKDLGNFALKREKFPDWTKSVVVTGSEQTEYFKVLYTALAEVFPEAKEKELIHIPTGFLSLTTGKMASRKGNVLSGEEMLAELRVEAKTRADTDRPDVSGAVAVAALKYQILKSRLGADIVFDKGRALSFEGDSGPYLQYTHARLGSVLEKANRVGVASLSVTPPLAAYPLEKILVRFPEVVQLALSEPGPHHLVGYLTELAGAFNTFYAVEKIADANDQYAPYKAALAAATRQTIKNGLWLLGIKAPERM